MGLHTCSYEVVNEYPHASDAYTQGLVFEGGRLIESTGIEGQSSLREVELETGEVIRQVHVDDEHFAEGIALVGDQVYQLTWISEEGFTYDLATFERTGGFSYTGEGWGLAFDGTQLIMSNGSSQLTLRDPQTFEITRTIDVTTDDEPVDRLNELEYIDGEIWANVWQTDRIARIDPATGRVTAWLDLTGLLTEEDRTPSASVLNGIAHDPATDRVFVTGKLWPLLFEIRVADCQVAQR